MPTRVYRYGCLPPTENAKLVDEQIFLAHRYRNKLVEIELARRAEIHAILDGSSKEKVEALRTTAKERAAEAVRQARANCGVYWGTYLLIEQAASQMRGCKDDPRFRRYTGDGRVGVQLQKGLTVANAFLRDSRLRLEFLSSDRHVSRRHNPDQGIGQGVVWLRIGSQGRTPVFASFPVMIHRALPADGVIKWAIVQRIRVGTRYRWELCLTVEQVTTTVTPSTNLPIIAIDLGWRKVEDGLRVGYCVTSTGVCNELSLPRMLQDKMEHARSIGAIRQRVFNEFLPRLVVWRGLFEQLDLPEWWWVQTTTIARWVSPDRLWRLYLRWRRERFDVGLDEELQIWDQVQEWAKRDRHLHDWADNESDKVLACRNDLYRKYAVQIVTGASRVVIEKWNMRRVIQESAAGKAGVIAKRASGRRHLSAPATFRLALRNICARLGVAIVEVDPAGTTQVCHLCGHAEPWDAAPATEHRCDGCGAVWDQDYNAGVNMLKRAASAPVASESPGALAEDKAVKSNGKSKRSMRFSAARAVKRAARSKTSGQVSENEEDLGGGVEMPAQRLRS